MCLFVFSSQKLTVFCKHDQHCYDWSTLSSLVVLCCGGVADLKHTHHVFYCAHSLSLSLSPLFPSCCLWATVFVQWSISVPLSTQSPSAPVAAIRLRSSFSSLKLALDIHNRWIFLFFFSFTPRTHYHCLRSRNRFFFFFPPNKRSGRRTQQRAVFGAVIVLDVFFLAYIILYTTIRTNTHRNCTGVSHPGIKGGCDVEQECSSWSGRGITLMFHNLSYRDFWLQYNISCCQLSILKSENSQSPKHCCLGATKKANGNCKVRDSKLDQTI